MASVPPLGRADGAVPCLLAARAPEAQRQQQDVNGRSHAGQGWAQAGQRLLTPPHGT